MKIKSLSVVFKLFTFLARLIYYVYEYFDCMDACVPCMYLVPEEVIRGSLRSLELSHCVGAGNQTRDLC